MFFKYQLNEFFIIYFTVHLYIPLTQLSFILAWSTFQAHVFAGNILNVGEPASYPVVDGNIHLILSLLGLLLFALTLLIFLLGRQGCLFQNIFNVLDLLQYILQYIYNELKEKQYNFTLHFKQFSFVMLLCAKIALSYACGNGISDAE
ncbi:Hypothetical_protein [Hexamita inflata]|uniref:Hypothetical_protein n=1 Tax=Hexamita inflata TaxID=28002 RepID=A0ABP1LMW9_9EUKA